MLSDAEKVQFLECAEQSATLASAIVSSRLRLSDVRDEMARDAKFSTAVEDALAVAIGGAEQAIYDRGVRGIEEPVFYQGERVPVRDPDTGEIRRDSNGDPIFHSVVRYDNRLAELFLQGNAPDKYARGRSAGRGAVAEQVSSGEEGAPDFSRLSDDEYESFLRLWNKACGKET